MSVTGHRPCRDGEGRALDQGHGIAAGEWAGANLGALQVKQDGHGTAHLARQAPDVGDHGGVLVIRTVRHVEARRV